MDQMERATREYLISLVATLKKTRAALTEERQELERWQSRVELARNKGREDLASQAEQRANEAEQRLKRLPRNARAHAWSR